MSSKITVLKSMTFALSLLGCFFCSSIFSADRLDRVVQIKLRDSNQASIGNISIDSKNEVINGKIVVPFYDNKDDNLILKLQSGSSIYAECNLVKQKIYESKGHGVLLFSMNVDRKIEGSHPAIKKTECDIDVATPGIQRGFPVIKSSDAFVVFSQGSQQAIAAGQVF